MANVGDEKDGKAKRSRDDAIKNAGDKFGPGTHAVKVVEESFVIENSPGQVTEYRITLKKTG